MKINPYIPKFNKYENYKNKIGNKPSYLTNEIKHLKNENNFRYSSYSNYLKKKKFIRKGIC